MNLQSPVPRISAKAIGAHPARIVLSMGPTAAAAIGEGSRPSNEMAGPALPVQPAASKSFCAWHRRSFLRGPGRSGGARLVIKGAIYDGGRVQLGQVSR